ncbi:helix-turn-helix transcriptional regulator [Streptomyces sp. NPDC046685]|uniref:helix-turn-helix domain-containing protein n=1 Tax=Streptomyces sp. NPDC046685 TaxID=3157202 RepID=UPI0034013C84
MDDGDRQLEAHIGEPSPFVDMVVGPGEADNSNFGGLLERLRWKAGLSRADAAAKLGFSSEYLRLIEVGKRTPALGQMRNLLSAYGAVGAVEEISPDGYRQDLLVFDPLYGDDGDPVIVEFTSRIREARRSALGGLPDDDEDSRQTAYERPTASRAAELGMVVSLLARADDATLRKIRKLLEERVN